LFVAGAGTAFGFIPVSIAGLAGVSEREAGLASGRLNTSQQLGGAIGVAIASTVAATHFKSLIGDGKTANVALAGGFQWAFWVCGAIALLALPSLALLRREATATGIEGATPALEADGVS
jgi:sugar phosphate permease